MRRLATLAVPLLLVAAACGAPPPHTAADLINPQLSPGLAQWLVGPVAHLATLDEVRAYLALTDDAAANAFIETFWARRDPDPTRPGNPLREVFDERASLADRRFSEAGYLGRRTDRGATFVLYGEPTKIDFEINPRSERLPVERWSYAATTAPGLDGKLPGAVYRFVKNGDLTVFYQVPLSQRVRTLPPAR